MTMGWRRWLNRGKLWGGWVVMFVVRMIRGRRWWLNRGRLWGGWVMMFVGKEIVVEHGKALGLMGYDGDGNALEQMNDGDDVGGVH
ncbi:hypothetical protein A2U01_0049122, partial [Trifolium medium]|nr:hypothetical protein [Trifolium medium]